MQFSELNLTKEQVDILLNLLEKAKTIMEQEKDVVISDDEKYKLQENIVKLYFEHHNFNIKTVRNLLHDKNYEKIIVSNEKYVQKCLNVDKDICLTFLNSEFLQPHFCGNFAIKYASKYELIDKIKELLNNPTVIPSVDKNKPLLLAVKHNKNTDIVKLLINHPDVIATEKVYKNSFCYALIEAIKQDKINMMKIILDHPDTDLSEKHSIIFEKIRLYLLPIEIITMLISHHTFNPSFEDNRLLKQAIIGNAISLVNILLDHPKIIINNSETFYPGCVYWHDWHNWRDIFNILLNHPEIGRQGFLNGLLKISIDRLNVIIFKDILTLEDFQLRCENEMMKSIKSLIKRGTEDWFKLLLDKINSAIVLTSLLEYSMKIERPIFVYLIKGKIEQIKSYKFKFEKDIYTLDEFEHLTIIN